MKQCITVLLILLSTSLSAQIWTSTWEQALQKANVEEKKIVLVFSGSDWCIPCIKLEKEVWMNEAFIAYAEETLILYRADFPKRKKNKLASLLQEQNESLAEVYNPKGYFPWVIVLSPSQKKIGSFVYERLPVSTYIEKIKGYLANLIDYAIDYFKDLKVKYGKGKERKTEIKTFESIDAAKVVVASKKLYVNREEGFIGTALRKDEYISDCSDIDDIIVFREDGFMKVVKVDSKVFVGKGIIHAAVFKKKDIRTIYNMVYFDGKSSYSMMKRFNVSSVTRNKDYSLTKSDNKSKILYFTANPNGEAETISIYLRKSQRLKILKFDYDFADLAIKGKASVGNILTKNRIKKIELRSQGVSTLGAREIWYDKNVRRLNVEGRGELLGEFSANDKILTINNDGSLELKSFDISTHFSDEMLFLEKHIVKKPISIVYFDGKKQNYFVKRFLIESSTQKFKFISDHKDSHLEIFSTDWRPQIEIIYKKEKGKNRQTDNIILDEFISIKGAKSLGNRLSSKKINSLKLLDSLEYFEENEEVENVISTDIPLTIINNNKINDSDDKGQTTLEL
mgnify:CR=1 FL=1